MSTQQRTIDYLLEQLAEAGSVSARKMFGEYALYCDGKVMALVCDDQLFIRPTQAGRAYLGTVTEGKPYPGAKPFFVIEGDRWEDADWLADLVRATADELPLPKPRPPKKPRKPKAG